MKKIFLVLLFMVSFLTIYGCEPMIDEGPNSITIDVLGLKGEGSLESPYLLNLMVNETIEKHVNVTGTYESLEYLYGKFINNKFSADETLGHVLVANETTDGYLIVKGLKVGQSMLRIKGVNLSSSAYIKVNVTDNENYKNSLKILAIGNSFSEDSTTYLGEIAAAFGIKEVIIGNLYIGGASLETHSNSIKNSTSSYTYYKNIDNKWENKGGKSLIVGLLDESWDIITLQQASGFSGKEESYQPFLNDIITFINEKKLTETTFFWHQTWAYAKTSSHSAFPDYGKDQDVMYQAIMDVNTSLILKHDTFKQIIPSGTAIQNVRSSFVGDNLTRDGYHLNAYGRYTAGLMWFKSMTGFNIDEITFKPSTVSELQMSIAKEAVNQAYHNKFQVTASSYQTK